MRRKELEVTDIEEIERIIKKCRVCHVAMVDNGLPYIVPLNFGYLLKDGLLELFFHSAGEGRKTDILKQNSSVCFEMTCEGGIEHCGGNPCNSGYSYESVIGFGQAEFIEDYEAKNSALSILAKHQLGYDYSFSKEQAGAVCAFKIISSDFTGKKSSR
ncbi:MAG: pyridoxamine 5'-phosphate oxidase family protein [Oscillospiraceae bacterium]|jgi:nitroimidazol reductase NimA-like FMN-containing flavoprotein (pyridoxamine 5'-phosphate oxidase superfamily)